MASALHSILCNMEDRPSDAVDGFNKSWPTRPSVRVVFSQPATSAVARSLAAIPDKAPLTLEQIEIGADAEALIATARQALSPHMFAAFLAWGEAAARFAQHHDDNEEAEARCDANHDALDTLTRLPALTFDDFALKAWLLAIEAGDCSCMGPLAPSDRLGGLLYTTAKGIAPDLDHASALTSALDALGRKVWAFSSSTLSWSVPNADAVIDAFRTARDVVRAPAPEFTRAEVERVPTRFHRGLLVQWDRAYRTFREATADAEALPSGTDDDALHAAWHLHYEALHRLMLTPAPSPAALAIKLRLHKDLDGWELAGVEGHAEVLATDARRFAKLGAFPQADATLLSAFELYQGAMREFDALPEDAPGSAEDVLYARMDPCEEALVDTPAHTVEGVIAKLRYGFLATGNARWRQEPVLTLDPAGFNAALAMEGMHERALWGAIEDLARIAGVELMGKAA